MSSIHKLEAGWAPQMRQQITSSFVTSQLKFAFAWSDIVLENEKNKQKHRKNYECCPVSQLIVR